MEEFFKKIDLILKAKFPDENDRGDYLENFGKLVLYKALDDSMRLFSSESNLQIFKNFANSGDYESMIKICNLEGIDFENMVLKNAEDLIKETFTPSV